MLERILIAILESITGKVVRFVGDTIVDVTDKKEVTKLKNKVLEKTKALELEHNETTEKQLIDSARKLAHTLEL